MPKFSELPKLIEDLNDKLKEIHEDIEVNKNINSTVSTDEIKDCENEYKKWRKIYKTRKSIYNRVRDTVCGEDASNDEVKQMEDSLGIDEISDTDRRILSSM